MKFRMIMSKKYYLMILFIISFSLNTIAQTGYYYKGKKIPLVVNDHKLCVSIPKESKIINERFLANVKVLKRINNENYNIFVILKSEFERLSSLDYWEKDAESMILSSSFFTKENMEIFETPYLNVRLKKEEDLNLLVSYAEQYGLRIVKQDPLMPLWYVLSVTLGCKKSTLQYANELFESGKFASSAPDFCLDDSTCSNDVTYTNDLNILNDPMFGEQWGLHNSENLGIDISVCDAWNYSTGKNIKIAILDEGVDMNHIDLAANIGNLSYDAVTHSSPNINQDAHGTHCAGIAAAVKDNGILIAGVAPEATIVPIRISFGVDEPNLLSRADGITWAYQNGVDIISNSWKSIHFDAIDEAIENAFRYGRNGKGCVVVFASGNEHKDSVDFPANCNDTILAVGAINRNGVRPSFSNYGTELDIVAPGLSILSTVLNDTTDVMSGTSMACPHVAGVAALILERNSELTVNQVNSIINSNAKKIPGVNFNVLKPNGSWNCEYGYGLVNAYESVIHTPSTVYIQNDTITGTRLISAESIYVGRDVTDTKEYGDVTLGQGDITLQGKYVEIKNSTTVPLGTTLNIGH